MSETLGLILIRAGVVTREGLYQALDVQRETGRYLGSCLLALGLVTPEQLREALSQQLGVELADGRAVLGADTALASEVPAEVVGRYRVVPYGLEGDTLRLAFYDPSTADALSEIGFFTGRVVRAALCDEAVVERSISRLYPSQARTMARLPQTGPRLKTEAENLPVGAPTETDLAPVTPPSPQPDRRRPAEIIKPLEEISNRDFGRALGLEEVEQDGAPIPLVSRRAAQPARDVPGGKLLSIVEAAEMIFEKSEVVDIAEIAVRFLRSFFDRAIGFDLSANPAPVLVRSGFPNGIENLDLAKYQPLVDIVRSGHSFHGVAPEGGGWRGYYQALGTMLPGSILVAPVNDTRTQRLLFYADTAGSEPYDDLHEAALLVREVATALSLLQK